VPQASQDAIPLISKITVHDEAVRPAIVKIFGKTMVTRTVAVGNELARDLNVDCITLEGDQVNRRGAMTGGFVDTSRSRIKAVADLRMCRTEREKREEEFKRIDQETRALRSQVNDLTVKLSEVEQTYHNHRSTVGRLKADNDATNGGVTQARSDTEAQEERLKKLERAIEKSKTVLKSMNAEVGTELVSSLSPEESGELETLRSEINELREKLAGVLKERSRLETRVNFLRNDIDRNYEKKIAELRNIVDSTEDELAMYLQSSMVATGDVPVSVEAKADALVAAEVSLEAANASFERYVSKIADLEEAVRKHRKKQDDLKGNEERLHLDLEKEKNRLELLFNKRSVLLQKKADAERKIRDLGSLPSNFEKYRSTHLATLMKKLDKTKESLKKYSHVNKKALDQYTTFCEQRDSLLKRKAELDAGAHSIDDLILSLDQRKDEDIMRTFKGVSKNFSEVFTELVPTGKASLVMLKSSDEEELSDDEPVEDEVAPASGKRKRLAQMGPIQYTGVAMKVSFTRGGESYLLQQLSGGQKSIVALALIFAIQRLDPAPFYLFDEIDANLDATHRLAVANLIQKQAAQGTQFITTTFRPEFVNAGDQWFGVIHRNKVSSLEEVSKEDALSFINDEPAR